MRDHRLAGWPSPAPARSTASPPILGDAPELASVLAALAALADSPSRLTGIGHIRQQETDRLAALATEINGLGGGRGRAPDGLAVRPRPLHGGVFASYDDHRLVMAAAVLRAGRPRHRGGEPGHRRQRPSRSSPACGRTMLEGTP